MVELAYSEEKIEDELLQVAKIIFHFDFLIIDYEADGDISIIFGRLFSATKMVVMDVEKRELNMMGHDLAIAEECENKMQREPPLKNTETKDDIKDNQYSGEI